MKTTKTGFLCFVAGLLLSASSVPVTDGASAETSHSLMLEDAGRIKEERVIITVTTNETILEPPVLHNESNGTHQPSPSPTMLQPTLLTLFPTASSNNISFLPSPSPTAASQNESTGFSPTPEPTVKDTTTPSPTPVPTWVQTMLPTVSPTESEIEKIILPIVRNMTQFTNHLVTVTVDLSFSEVIVLLVLLTGCCTMNLVLLSRLALNVLQLVSSSTTVLPSSSPPVAKYHNRSYLSTSESRRTGHNYSRYSLPSLGKIFSGSHSHRNKSGSHAVDGLGGGSKVQRNRNAPSSSTEDGMSGQGLLQGDDTFGDDHL
jgi:hypothetical protein